MTRCPKCGRNEYGPGPFMDQFKWIGCYACGFGFKDMNKKQNMNKKSKIFQVSATPKGLDNVLDVQPNIISQNYCAVINVADSPCATFDYQRHGVPSFWFPINEIGAWGHSPFYGALKVVNEYHKWGDKPVLIHCHAGANRSPSVAYAVLLAKGYTPLEAEKELDYPELSGVFTRNIERKHIPSNIIDFLKEVERSNNPTLSLNEGLRRLNALYDEWAGKTFDEQNDYTLKADSKNPTRLVYNRDKKRFILTKDD